MRRKLALDMLPPVASLYDSAAFLNDFACNPSRAATRAAPSLQ